MATQAFVRTITKVIGGEVVADVMAFLNAFEGMEAGFRERAQAVYDLLADPATAFVLVASPRRDAVDEAVFFADKLAEANITVQGLVVNRVHPSFGDALPAPAPAPAPEGSALAVLEANLAELNAVAHRERRHLGTLLHRVEPAPSARVPFLKDDVHDLTGLALIAGHLLPA